MKFQFFLFLTTSKVYWFSHDRSIQFNFNRWAHQGFLWTQVQLCIFNLHFQTTGWIDSNLSMKYSPTGCHFSGKFPRWMTKNIRCCTTSSTRVQTRPPPPPPPSPLSGSQYTKLILSDKRDGFRWDSHIFQMLSLASFCCCCCLLFFLFAKVLTNIFIFHILRSFSS